MDIIMFWRFYVEGETEWRREFKNDKGFNQVLSQMSGRSCCRDWLLYLGA